MFHHIYLNSKTFRFAFKTAVITSTAFLINCSMGHPNDASSDGTKFAVSFDTSVREQPTSGRILLLLSRSKQFAPGENGTPIFGINVDDLNPGENAIIDADVRGYPVSSLENIPAGDYYVQAYLNVYTTFHRSDGYTVKLHKPQRDGHNWRRTPGNLFSTPKKVHYNPTDGSTISITMDQVLPPIPEFQETEWVKYVRIKSKLLTEFWGQPMYIAARVLLPAGFYDHPESRYPVIYMVGHYPRGKLGYPGGFMHDGGSDVYPITKPWKAGELPKTLLVRFEHETPYYDDSYGVNSENMGPYGDALTQELIPLVEEKFRGIGEAYARLLTGGSTGGWISLAMQVWYPDFFGGTWTFYPDNVDFHKYQQANLYEDDNAYFVEHEWTTVARPAMRNPDGSIVSTMEQANHYEEVIGDRYRSGGQYAVWNALFAPVANDGYPQPLYDPWTGEIDHEVTDWARENYDIVHKLKTHWASLGPKLVGKLNMYTGRMDHFYLNEGVYLLDEFLKTTENPHYSGRFVYSSRGGHGWNPWLTDNLDFDPDERLFLEMYQEMIEHILKNAPEWEDNTMWNY